MKFQSVEVREVLVRFAVVIPTATPFTVIGPNTGVEPSNMSPKVIIEMNFILSPLGKLKYILTPYRPFNVNLTNNMPEVLGQFFVESKCHSVEAAIIELRRCSMGSL